MTERPGPRFEFMLHWTLLDRLIAAALVLAIPLGVLLAAWAGDWTTADWEALVLGILLFLLGWIIGNRQGLLTQKVDSLQESLAMLELIEKIAVIRWWLSKDPEPTPLLDDIRAISAVFERAPDDLQEELAVLLERRRERLAAHLRLTDRDHVARVTGELEGRVRRLRAGDPEAAARLERVAAAVAGGRPHEVERPSGEPS